MRMRLAVPVLLLALSAGAFRAAAEEAAPPAMDEAALKAILERMSPGPEHAALMKQAGAYEIASKVWMDPAKPPEETKASATFTAILEGRYLRQEFQGSMMGKPFTGLGIEGYDKEKKEYVCVWFDSMGLIPFTLRGKSADGGKNIEYHGSLPCPMDGKEVKQRYTCQHLDENTFTFTMYETREGGKEVKGMEMTYTRKK
ncbi:MAG: hypothetical protein AMXMBFR7_14580 [Planctomycetota bacterium]